MRRIDNITDQANQVIQVVLSDGSLLQMTLVYRPATQRWTMDVSHPLLTTTNIGVVDYPNLLRPWIRLITFGLACVTVSGQDPVDISDFVNGNAAIYALTEAEVLQVEEDIFGGVLQ